MCRMRISLSVSPQRCLTLMNRGFAFGLVNHYMCHFGLKDPKVSEPCRNQTAHGEFQRQTKDKGLTG